MKYSYVASITVAKKHTLCVTRDCIFSFWEEVKRVVYEWRQSTVSTGCSSSSSVTVYSGNIVNTVPQSICCRYIDLVHDDQWIIDYHLFRWRHPSVVASPRPPPCWLPTVSSIGLIAVGPSQCPVRPNPPWSVGHLWSRNANRRQCVV